MTLLLLAASLLVPLAGAEEEEGEEDGSSSLIQSLDIGLQGSMGREANWRDHDWGPTLSLGLLTSEESSHNRFSYELEYGYNDASSKLIGEDSTQKTRVRSHELKYGKISFLKLGGYDLQKRLRLTPYVAGGVQYVDSKEETYTPADEEEEVEESTELHRSYYWSPTWSAGVEFYLNRRTTFSMSYEQNMKGGDRRMARLSLGLNVSLFGASEE